MLVRRRISERRKYRLQIEIHLSNLWILACVWNSFVTPPFNCLFGRMEGCGLRGRSQAVSHFLTLKVIMTDVVLYHIWLFYSCQLQVNIGNSSKTRIAETSPIAWNKLTTCGLWPHRPAAREARIYTCIQYSQVVDHWVQSWSTSCFTLQRRAYSWHIWIHGLKANPCCECLTTCSSSTVLQILRFWKTETMHTWKLGVTHNCNARPLRPGMWCNVAVEQRNIYCS